MDNIEQYNKTGYIAAIARGHNAGVCLLKDGEVVFSIEEERLSRRKYDGGPYASMVEILKYTDKIDYLVIAHTQSLKDPSTGRVDYSGDDVYTGMARKLGLIDQHIHKTEHPQVIDLSHIHHKLHAACAFYRSGFDKAVAVIVDGAGTFIPIQNSIAGEMTVFEVESIFSCDYPNDIFALYKHYGTGNATPGAYYPQMDSENIGEAGHTHEAIFSDKAGIVKVYEAVTQYCGFSAIEAGKTMGLFPYGKKNDVIPPLFQKEGKFELSNRNLIIPTYPNASVINSQHYPFLDEQPSSDKTDDWTKLQSRRDLSYAVQKESQKQCLDLIYKAVEMSGCKNVVFSGGYGLNCVANYYYLESLQKDGIKFYAEPVSNDAGTAMGAAMLFYYSLTQTKEKKVDEPTLYLGPKRTYTDEQIQNVCAQDGVELTEATNEEVVKIIAERNIVSIFQGASENGPRALGNRSILYDPRDPDGKDHVNKVKHREYFRPFAGTILHEFVHEWFDLRGMEETPHMMYAVNCQPGIEEKIPSIIHVDGTCRIQSVKREQNPLYYDLIKEFHKQTDCPIIFNTSFNLGGEPLVETLEDAVRTLIHSEIEYLYLPEYNKLIKVANK